MNATPSPDLPPRGAELAARAYQGESGRHYHGGKRGVPPSALPWIHALRAAKFQGHVGPADVVFEFGAGAGWNLAGLKCARRVAFDVSAFLAPELQRWGIEFVTDPDALPEAFADVVLCHHALEHVLEPTHVLGQLHRLLKSGGVLLVHVPWERERSHACYRPDEPNRHLYGWSPQTLGNLAAVLGWRIQSVRSRRYGYDRFAAALAHRLHLGQVGFRLLRALLVTLRPLKEVELMARK